MFAFIFVPVKYPRTLANFLLNTQLHQGGSPARWVVRMPCHPGAFHQIYLLRMMSSVTRTCCSILWSLRRSFQSTHLLVEVIHCSTSWLATFNPLATGSVCVSFIKVLNLAYESFVSTGETHWSDHSKNESRRFCARGQKQGYHIDWYWNISIYAGGCASSVS